jgi:plastocyanin
MSNWELMMPGMGLTAIGVAGVTISYSGIANTFIDGMHALTGLTMFIGLIFLSAGILEGGVSTSNRAKATTLVILSIVLAFGMWGIGLTKVTTVSTFAGLLIIIAIPSIVITYFAMKKPEYVKPMAVIFILASASGIIAFVGFGVYGPSPYLLDDQVIEEVFEEISSGSAAPVFSISILAGSAEQGNPDYDPDVANISQGYQIEWTNDDSVSHTVTSSLDFGETFDSGLLNAGEAFVLDSNDLSLGEYEYMCIVHPWMISTIIIEEPKEPVIVEVSIVDGAGIQQPGQIYYDPELLTVDSGTTVIWNNDDSTIHTVTAGTAENGPSGRFDSELIGAGESFEYTFSTSGTEDYYCIVHPWMTGTVTVE